jgi:hypothetical protein
MTLEGRFSHGGNVKTFVAAFAVCFMNIWAISNVKQGFIYENAQKKMLESCNFCLEKSLLLLNTNVYEP